MSTFDSYRSFHYAAAGVLLTAAITGCQNALRLGDGLRLVLEAPSEVPLGQPLSFTLRVSNDGPDRLQLIPNGLPTGFEILVFKEDGTQVWSSVSDDVTIADSERHFELEKGESMAFQATWNQSVIPGASVPPGAYYAIGVLRESNRAPRQAMVRFTIRPAPPNLQVGVG